jgi:response regulator NasT
MAPGEASGGSVAEPPYVAAVTPLAAVADVSVRGHDGTPTVVLLDRGDGTLARCASESGVEPLLVRAESIEAAVQGAIDDLRELQRLRALYGRVRLVERAKGILMERHGVSERKAYELLHKHARNSNLRLSEVAQAVLDSHVLLAGAAAPEPLGG